MIDIGNMDIHKIGIVILIVFASVKMWLVRCNYNKDCKESRLIHTESSTKYDVMESGCNAVFNMVFNPNWRDNGIVGLREGKNSISERSWRDNAAVGLKPGWVERPIPIDWKPFKKGDA